MDNHIATICENETILVVAQGCFILILLSLIMKKSFGHDMSHTGATKLVYDDGWDFVYFNNTSHLYERIDSKIKSKSHVEIF